MIKVKFTVPVTFQGYAHCDMDSDEQDVIDELIKDAPFADIVGYDPSLMDIDWDTAEVIEDWEVEE